MGERLESLALPQNTLTAAHAHLPPSYQKLIRGKASAATRFRGEIAAMPLLSAVTVQITGDGSAALHLGPKTDESYTITVRHATAVATAVATVSAPTAFGLKHGLETLAQLVRTPDGVICGVNATLPLSVADKPAWPYRAVMIDTGRHYLNLAAIRRAIDGMGSLKLNVLHWHLLDSASFPVQSELFPALSQKGAYAEAAVYSLADLRAVVAYGRSRGVRIVPEIEMPVYGL